MDDLAASTENSQGTSQPDITAHFTELVDRGGKLAFQIAMEVASLGARGERLLPMAQALEELTTEFRESSGQITGAAASHEVPNQTNYQEMVRKIDGLTGLLDSAPEEARPSLKSRSQDLALVAEKISTELDKISGSFNHQAERLTDLGTSFAALTGVAFDPEDLAIGKPENPPAGSLNLSQSDPFAKEIESPQPAEEIDPFATADSLMPADDAVDKETDFSADVTPGLESFGFSSSNEPEPVEEPVAEHVVEPAPEPAPEPVAEPAAEPLAGPAADPVLSTDEERVYDLSEFDAVSVEDSSDGAAQEDRIYDLAEFGAVGLD